MSDITPLETESPLETVLARTEVAETRTGRRNGRLQTGNPGNAGSWGKPPSVVRERCRTSFYELIPTLEKIAGRMDAEDRDRIRAIDTLGRYGLMTGRLDIEEVRLRLARTIAKVEELADPQTAERILSAIEPIWNPNKDK